MLNVSKVYPNGVAALRGVDIGIGKGEFVFLVGASGAGKSTFVRLAYREETPTSGQIFVDGRNVARLKPREVPFFRRNIGVVFQDFKLIPGKTVHENVAFALEVTEAPRREIRKRVPAVLSLVGLADKAGYYPAQLSGGEQQRASLARAIVNRPALILADEPTGNLDPETSWDIINLLLEINRRGATVVVATHARAIVDRLQKRVVAIEAGHVVRDQERGVYRNAV